MVRKRKFQRSASRYLQMSIVNTFCIDLFARSIQMLMFAKRGIIFFFVDNPRVFQFRVLITMMGDIQSIFSEWSGNECKLLLSLLHVGGDVVGCIIQMDKCTINDWHAFEDVLQTLAEIVAIPQTCKASM